jgi:hypothetical protein
MAPSRRLRGFGTLQAVLFPGRSVRKDRDIIQQWTAFGDRMVITLVLLGFPAVRPHLAFDGYLIITSVLVAIGTASAFHIVTAGQVMRLRSAAWISASLGLDRAGGLTVGQPSADLDRIGITQSSAQVAASGRWSGCSP